MRFTDLVDTYKTLKEAEILEETRLSTEFTIGFELEAICDSDDPDLESEGNLPSYHSSRDRPEGGSEVLLNKLNDLLNMGDGSIRTILDDDVATITKGKDIYNFDAYIIKWKDKALNDFTWYIRGGYVYVHKGDTGAEEISVGSIERNKIEWTDDVLRDLPQLPKNLTINRSKIESDGSVHPDDSTNSTGHAWSFEWGSPIIKFNPRNIDKIQKFLNGLEDIGVYTNNSCGFHTHISYDGMTRDDIKWILFCIANDDVLYNEIETLRVPGEAPIKFFGHYAQAEWFDELKVKGNLENWSFRGDTSNKYLMMRVHPDAGTLEWRGPRNFIRTQSEGGNETIKAYLTKLWKLILNIAKIVDEKEHNGYKKSEVLNKMTITGKFNSKEEKGANISSEKLIELLSNSPEKLITLKPSKLKNLITVKPRTFIDIVITSNISEDSEKMHNIWMKLPLGSKKVLSDFIARESSLQKVFTLAIDTNTGKADSVSSEVIIDSILSINSSYIESMIRDNLDSLTIDRPEILEKIYNSKKLSIKDMVKLLAKFPRIVSMKILAQIANSNQRYVLSSFSELPIKIQRLLIRKNPYNIQYINNPDQSIINELKKKYGDEIDDYILGVL